MNKYRYIIFDLDGTISDPKEGLINSIVYSCKKFGINDYNPEEFTSFIGPPLHISYKSRFNLSDAEAEKIVKYYREYYSDKGKFENSLYSGIPEFLEYLKSKNYILAVATSKPTVFSKEILEHFCLADYFDVVIGSNLDNTMSEKSEIIAEVIKKLNLEAPNKCIMIGDRKFDIIGAHQNGIKCISMLYGYGSMQEFKAHNADYIFETLEEIKQIL